MEKVDEFIEQLLNEKGITDVEPEIKEELKKEMRTRLIEQIDRAAIMQLPEDKAAELAGKTEDPNFTNEDLAQFIQESGVDLTQVAIDTMLEFRNYYLNPED